MNDVVIVADWRRFAFVCPVPDAVDDALNIAVELEEAAVAGVFVGFRLIQQRFQVGKS